MFVRRSIAPAHHNTYPLIHSPSVRDLSNVTIYKPKTFPAPSSPLPSRPPSPVVSSRPGNHCPVHPLSPPHGRPGQALTSAAYNRQSVEDFRVLRTPVG